MSTATKPVKRRGEGPPSPRLGAPDYPFTMKLPDGRILYVEVPACWVTRERGGKTAFLPPAIRLLDRIQALAMSVLDRPPSPGYIVSLREALGLTQEEFGARLGVDKMTVSRWERGTVRPGRPSLAALERVRCEAARKGVTISAQ